MKKHNISLRIFLASALLLLASCAAGNVQFTSESPAGFLSGLWHGIIALISLVINLFNDNIHMYEINNVGGWYDFGFLLGVFFVCCAGSRISSRPDPVNQCDKEWDEIGRKVEIKVMRKLKEWAENEEPNESGEDWDKVGEKVEKKLKRKIREWTEKE